jgi:N-acetyl sugar amidotransferase
MSSRSLSILVALPLLGQPRHAKRISMLQAAGFTIQAVAFERVYHRGRLPTCSIAILGKISHGHYLARLWVMFRSLNAMRAKIRSVDCVYATGLDMTFLSMLAGLGLRRPMVIEIGDVREIQLKTGLQGAIVRVFDQLVVSRCDLLIATAPDFVTEYYVKRLGVKIPSLVLENKLEFEAMGDSTAVPLLPRDPLKERPIRIGYFGLLRCAWTWSVLSALARARPHDIEIILAGFVTSPADLEVQVKALPNATYLGEYKSPDGLSDLYNQVDLVWACYPPIAENDWNLRWARTNRFYEACFFKRPLIARSGSRDAHFVAKHGIGLVLDAETPEELIDQVRNVDHDDVARWANNIGQLPESTYMLTSEVSELKQTMLAVTSACVKRPYQICSNCVMDTTDTDIVFDGDGVCDHCNTFYQRTLQNWHCDEKGQASLDRMVEQIKVEGEGKDFDCIIGMSGGIDSSYLTYISKEKLGLRPLVFHVDAGWNSQVAVNNIERMIDGLGLDLFTEVIDWEEMKDLQLAYFQSGVPHIDTPQDHAFFATMYKFAAKHRVKYILTGANLSTECIRNPIEWMYYQSDSRQLRDIHGQFGSRPLNSFPVTSILWHKIWLPYARGIKVLRPLDNLPYVKEEAKKLLMDRFGWQPYPQKHFESRFTKFYESYWLPKRFGYDVRRVQYSSLILTGQMARTEALEQQRQPPYDEATIGQEIEFVANKMGISVGELNSYMNLPKKTYKDYRNQRELYDLGARVMHMLGMNIGGKR